MGAVAFNTYEFIKSLEDAGMDEQHAAAISAGILRAHEVADLATKADLHEVRAEIREVRAEIREVQAQTKADLQEMRAEIREVQAQTKADLQEMRAEIREVQAQTKADLQEVRAEMQEIRAEIREMELRMTIKLGSMMIMAVGILAAVVKLL